MAGSGVVSANFSTPYPETGFTAEIRSVNLADLIQLACLEGKERVLHVQSMSKTGKIFFSKGEIVHAETEGLTGTDAFFEIMTWSAGEVMLSYGETGEISIDMSWNFLLIEALRKIDEGREASRPSKTAEVLIVDDSSLISKALKKIFNEQLGVKVAGEAPNGKDALRFMKGHTPDLVTLDINMPVMSGDVTIKHIMIRSPAPVVIISGIDESCYPKMMEFIRLGAVDVISKPEAGHPWTNVEKRLANVIERLQNLHIKNIRRARTPVRIKEKIHPVFPAKKLLVIIGGTGGLLELQKIMPCISLDAETAIIVFQDMCCELNRYFASYMDAFTSYLTIRMEEDNFLLGGQCIVGSWQGNWEIRKIEGKGISLVCTDRDGPVELDNMLITASELLGASLKVFILSGCDVDMEIGLESVSSAGGTVLFQTPETCLYPAPLIKMTAMELEDKCIDVEKLSGELKDFLQQNEGEEI